MPSNSSLSPNSLLSSQPTRLAPANPVHSGAVWNARGLTPVSIGAMCTSAARGQSRFPSSSFVSSFLSISSRYTPSQHTLCPRRRQDGPQAPRVSLLQSLTCSLHQLAPLPAPVAVPSSTTSTTHISGTTHTRSPLPTPQVTPCPPPLPVPALSSPSRLYPGLSFYFYTFSSVLYLFI